jgi:hypothetical protein
MLIDHYRQLGKIHAKANALKQALEDLAQESEEPLISELIDSQGDICDKIREFMLQRSRDND